jgi:hypothetical protein
VGQKGHYCFSVPIQPDEGDNMTVFVVRYHLTYSGKYTFSSKVLTPVSSYVVQLPKAMTFTAGSGENFQPVHPPQQSPGVQFFLLKDALPGKALEFTVAGNGSMPREDQGAQGGPQSGMGGQDSGGAAPDSSAGAAGGQPGGGIGNPINTPDPLSKYKWWILGGMALLLVVAAAFLLRKPAGAPATGVVADSVGGGVWVHAASASSTSKNSALLNALKEELFALESEKLTGTIDAGEYAEQKAALETVLKRALKK